MSTMLTLRQVAERLGLHVNTVRRYVYEGVIPVIRFGRAIRVEEKDLEGFIRAQKRKAKKKVNAQQNRGATLKNRV